MNSDVYFDLASRLAYAQAEEALGLRIDRPHLIRPCEQCATYATLKESREGIDVFECPNAHVALVAKVTV